MEPDRPRDGTRLFLLDGEGVLLSEAANELCSLSPLGVLVWQGLECGRSAAAITRTAQETFGLTAADAATLTQSAIALMRAHGLVAGSDLPERPGPATEPAIDQCIPPYDEPDRTFERHYSVLGSRVAVRFTEPEQERWVHPVFAHLETTEPQPADVVIDLVAGDGHHFVYRDGAPARFATAIDTLAPVVKEVLWLSAVQRYPYFLYLHAGVVGDGERCFLLPAASGSGKSSLTAALCRLGFEYFSDEVALIEPGTFQVRAIPLSICVKEAGWEMIARYHPEISALATHRRADRKAVRYLPPPGTGSVDLNRSYPVSHIVFPRYDRSAATEIRRISRMEALRRLMDDCLAIRPTLDTRNVAGLVEWMSALATYELTMSSLDGAAELVRELASR